MRDVALPSGLRWLIGVVALLVAFQVPGTAPGATCTTTLDAGSDVAGAVSNVVSGGTVCLRAGSYPAFSRSVTKSSMTTITPATGVSQSQVTIGSVDVGSSQNLQFQNMTIGGATIGTYSMTALHVHFVGNRFTSGLGVSNPANANNTDVVIDNNTLANISTAGLGGEGRVQVNGLNVNHSGPNGVVIKHNTFGPGGATDGIQINGGANGTQVLNNEFTGIKESGCGVVHCDPLQFYGGSNTVISGNYFHNNSTGIMSGDGNGSPMTITDNVFATDGEYAQQVVIGGGSRDIVSHNTFSNGASIRIGHVNVGASSNETVTDNVLTGGFWFSEGQSSSGFTIDYNLIPGGGGGTHGINGSPQFQGGPAASTYAGFDLVVGSIGTNAAANGADMGIPPSSTGSGDTTPTQRWVFTGIANAGKFQPAP